MLKTFINWLISALILWGLSFLTFLPFINISFSGSWGFGRWFTIVIVAVVLGLINALIGPVLHGAVKKASPLVLLALSFVINGALIWLTGIIVVGFSVGIVTAIIAAVVLAVLGTSLNQGK